VAQLLPGKLKYRYVNMASSSNFDYEEELLTEIEDSEVKCVLVLEHFTFEPTQVHFYGCCKNVELHFIYFVVDKC
jgi:hypothetical protein